MVLEYVATQAPEQAARGMNELARTLFGGAGPLGDPAALIRQQTRLWTEGLAIWQRAIGGLDAPDGSGLAARADRDRRFADKAWRDNPLFDTVRQTYLLISERLLGSVEEAEGIDEATRE